LKDVSVINLDASKDRWTALQPQLQVIPYPIHRFSAIDGRAMEEKEYDALGIPILIRPSMAREDLQKKRKGEIGCYLSHRTLIQQLGRQWTLPNAGHLILEDDVIIDRNCMEVLNRAFWSLPADWDILLLGIGESKVEPQGLVSKVHRFWGTYAYMVRHGSVPKISRAIETMFDPIDEMLWQKGLNIYALQPPVIHFRLEAFSEIQQKVT